MKFGKYIAHRGLHSLELWAPENSLEAFRRAVEKGFAIELDIHLTKDYQLAVFHDDNLARMTGLNKNIVEMTMKELKQLRLQGTSEKIPTLLEVLNVVDGKVPLLIEIKNTTKQIGKLEKVLARQMRYYKGFWAVQAFNPLRLNWFSKNMPKIQRGQLVSCNNEKNIIKRIFKNFISKPFVWKFISKPNFLAYDLRCISMEVVMLAIQNNCELLTWVAKSQELLKEAEKFSDSIIFEGFIPDI